MFSLPTVSHAPAMWPLLLAGYLALSLPQVLFRSGWGTPGLALLIAVICLVFFAFRHRIFQKPNWVLFTSNGLAIRQQSAHFDVIPWDDIHHVRFVQQFAFRKRDLRTWVLVLHLEPNSFLFRRRNALTRSFGKKLKFQIVATEEDAKEVVKELRRRFANAWQIQA